ncbi:MULTISPECIES: DUF4139 domain-containing protein [Halomonas]|uniref:DUF4139 domain-containing protein n=2 Tax=Halomonas TaxID=2745 RepID=A0A7X5ALX0_9GAMM|nr:MULTISPECIES: DUF4139 domain-containing protein [Halomonas]MDR5902253.1 DUF4139 domain-containing protein [Halomonas icarae]NAW12063.1 DUF4139 domain-containing protein [Halomonas icarae]TDB05634.1 DUF4139 domain-containing protein [Halomonas marinisediminis]
MTVRDAVSERGRRHSSLRLVILLAGAWPVGSATAAELPIEAVTLSSGGLAEVQRRASLEGDGTLYLEVPLEQVNDVLKSLMVRDPAGRLQGLSLDGLATLEETYRRLPFGPEDLGSIARLADSLQGVKVRVSSGGQRLEGLLLGVAEHGVEESGRAVQTLSLLDEEGGVATLRLGDDARLEVLDPALRERLAEAAEVSGRARTDEMRRIAIDLDGEGERDVSLTYVVAAPVWKSTYRLLLEADNEAHLQAWSVIENASGSDWSDVALTLSSGAPVTLTQRLLERYWPARTEVPVTADSIAPVRPDEGAMEALYGAKAESMMAYGDAAVSRSAAAPSAPASRPEVVESATAATWRLPTSVDLAAGRTLSLPYIDAVVPARRVSLYQPERGERHPVAAVRLENTTDAWLPPGLVTVYDAGVGHVGDVNLPGIPAGESRLASFAADRKVRIAASSHPEERLERMVIVDGALRITHQSRRVTRYAVENDAREAREVLIEHPRRSGWEFASEALMESTPRHHRLALALAPGESGEVMARETRVRRQSMALANAGVAQLIEWRDAADGETSVQLERVLERRRALDAVEQELEDVEERLARAVERQARIRDNLAAVGSDNALGQRYLGDLEAAEEKIASLEAQRETLEAERETRRETLAETLRELS